MFENIGNKLKNLAKITCWFGIITYILLAVVLSSFLGVYGLIIGLFISVSGCFVSWIMSFFVYGFGELIDKVCVIEKKLRRESIGDARFNQPPNNSKINQNNVIAGENLKTQITDNIDIEVTESEYVNVTCPCCSSELSFQKHDSDDFTEILSCPFCNMKFPYPAGNK